MADYYYSLIVAPSQISFLAENAVKGRMRFISSTQRQIEVSQGQRGAAGVNAWVNGDVAYLSMDNANGFPNDPSTPASLSGGLDVRVSPNLIVGGVISTGRQFSTFSTGGKFKQDELALSAYAGFSGGAWWGNAITTYGQLNYDVNRTAQIGITTQSNTGSVSGGNWSVAFQGGYKFGAGLLSHGPIAGLALQRVAVSSFTESGSFTSLAFGDQVRNSAVSSLGYRAALDLGTWRPYAQLSWNHELANTDRDVTAFLTTFAGAPGYSMPGVKLGKDWATASIGTTWALAPSVTAVGSLTSDFGQNDTRTYGGQLGLHMAF